MERLLTFSSFKVVVYNLLLHFGKKVFDVDKTKKDSAKSVNINKISFH